MTVTIKKKAPDYGLHLGSSAPILMGAKVQGVIVKTHTKEDGTASIVKNEHDLGTVLNDKPKGKIGVSMGRTFASDTVPFLKKYESLKVDVWLSMPTEKGTLQEDFEFVSDWVSTQLQDVEKGLTGQTGETKE